MGSEVYCACGSLFLPRVTAWFSTTIRCQKGASWSWAGTKQGQPCTRHGALFVPARFVPVMSLLICPFLSLFCPCSVFAGFVPVYPCLFWPCWSLICPCFLSSYNKLKKYYIHCSPFKSILASDRILSKSPKSILRRLLCRVLIDYIFAHKFCTISEF